MPETPSPYLKARTEQGALVLTITAAQMRGDGLAHALGKQLLEAVPQAGAPPNVVLDLKPVVSLSSEAFRPLLSVRRHVQEAGGRLVLCNLSPGVARALQTTRLLSTNRTSPVAFEVQPDVPAALASLGAGAGE